MSHDQLQPAYDVIISGAGPVGLFLAIELAIANCSVLVLEKAENLHSPLKQLPFGLRGLNALSIEVLSRRGLLDSYFTERHLIGARVLDWSRAQAAIVKPTSGARALNAIMRELMETRDGATYMAGRLWGVTTHYDLEGDHPLVGHSVPNFEFENGLRLGELMNDGRGMLLDFEDMASLNVLASGYSDQLKYVSGRAKERLGLSALLVRPDGFVAWASDGEPEEQSIRQAAALWFSRKETR